MSYSLPIYWQKMWTGDGNLKLTTLNLLLLISLFISIDSLAADKSAEKLIIDFYQSYFNYTYSENNRTPPELPFSKNFQKLINENSKACELYEPGICGWDAQYDVYTNSQESDENLTIENSNFTSSLLPDNQVRVTFNLFPTDSDPYYDRVITFKVIFEDGNYVVDDILYGNGMSSTIDSIKDEIEYIKKYPNPDSRYCREARKNINGFPKKCEL